MYGVDLGKTPSCVTSDRLDPVELEEGSQGGDHISGPSPSTELRVERRTLAGFTLANSPMDS